MKLALIGICIGLTGSLVWSKVIAILLFGVTATDPVTFISVSALLLFVGLLACLVPARRAMKVDPLVALRYE
jgi:putative ABC transport system permease protein